ncbi:MAG: hypothetical protein VW878_06670 [Candidatus Poseidoniales archaeon]|jgi:hypothetical protein
MKKIFALSTASILAASPAIAGPYVESETNIGWQDGKYGSALTETHLGYESDLGKSSSWFIQAGPAFRSTDGEGMEYLASGKVGISTALTEKLDAYGELSAISAKDYDFTDLGVGAKLGLKYSF